MAITYVGGKTHAFPGVTVPVNISLTDLTGGSDAAPAYGDIVVLGYSIGSFTAGGANVSSVGYTSIASLHADDSIDSILGAHHKRMGAAPDTSVSVNGTGSANNAGSIAIQVWRGVDSTTPMDVTRTTATGTNSCRADPPSITPSTAGAIVLGIGAGARATGEVFTSGDLSNFLTATSADTFDTTVGMGSVAWTSGAVDPAAFGTATDTVDAAWCAVTIALRPGVTQALAPALFTNDNTFYAPAITVSAHELLPSLLSNSQTFYGPTITVGMVTLEPPLIAGTTTIYDPVVTQGATVIQVPLLTNSQTFYGPTITTGAVSLTPSLLTNTQTFFAPTITTGAVTLTPALFTNTQTFYAPTVTRGGLTLSPSLLASAETIFAPTVSRGAINLQPALLTNTQNFYSPTITLIHQSLFPPLLTNAPIFYAATVTDSTIYSTWDFTADTPPAGFDLDGDGASGWVFTPDAQPGQWSI